MKYLQRSFTLAMPGGHWPFPSRIRAEARLQKLRDGTYHVDAVELIAEDENLRTCPACGAVDRPGETHIAAGHTDRPVKKVCFDLKDSQ